MPRHQPRVRFKRLTAAQIAASPEAVHSITPQLARPLEKALTALKAGQLVEALQQFAECAQIEPTNKAVLYFGSDAAQRAYFSLKYADPKPPAERAAKWRDAALALTVACHEAAPHDPVAIHNVGRFLQDDGDDASSIPCYKLALQLDRTQVESWGNLGNALAVMGDTQGAELCWSKCIAFDARHPSSHMAQAYVWLRRGDYARGWPALNERWRDQTFQVQYGRPDLRGLKAWTGQPLRKHESLLLHGEQGLGDHVQFARYVQTLNTQGIKVAALETRSPLKRWFEACLPGLPILIRDQDAEHPAARGATHQAPLISLPGILKLAAFPPPLSPNVNRFTPAQDGERRRVGLVWHGTTGNPMDYQRSVPVEALAELADIPGVAWVPLQYDPSGQDALTASLWLGSTVEQAPAYKDVLELAEIMAGLDLIVTVDTLAAHVAGSLGIPTIILHRFSREWRWGQYSERTDWYPSVTNLTQAQPDDWTELLGRLRQVLTGA